MKRVVIVLAILMLMVVGGCGRTSEKPVVKTVTMKAGNGEKSYTIIYENGKGEAVDQFTPDEVTFLYADNDDFESNINSGRVNIRLKDTKLTDADGNPVDADERVLDIMQSVADNAEHDIFDVMILIDGGKYFVFEKHNVNLQTPCVLYKYNGDARILEKLYQWDDAELIGIAL